MAAGKEIPGQNSLGHAQDLTGETTYHWLKDIAARVTSIEGRLTEEDKTNDKESTVSPDEDDSHMFVTRPEVKECHWEAFKNRFPTEDNKVPAIETLLRSAELVAEVQEEQLKRQSQGSLSPPAYQKPFKASSKSPSSAPDDTYERIRINSALILAFLSKAAEDGSLANPPLKPLTFLRPFKVLVHFHEQMEKEFLWLEKKFGSTASADQALALETERSPDIIIPEEPMEEDQRVNKAMVLQKSVPEIVQDVPVELHVDPSEQKERDNTVSPTTPNQNEGKVKSRHDLRKFVENGSYEAYRQMKCYVNFVRTKLIPRYKNFDLDNHREPPRVRYSDLWSLFRVGELVLPGEAVYQRDTNKSGDGQLDSDNLRFDTKEPQLWRVFRISLSSTASLPRSPSIRMLETSMANPRVESTPATIFVRKTSLSYDMTSCVPEFWRRRELFVMNSTCYSLRFEIKVENWATPTSRSPSAYMYILADLHTEVIEAYQVVLPDSVAWKPRLLELVVTACHNIAVFFLYQMDDAVHKPAENDAWHGKQCVL